MNSNFQHQLYPSLNYYPFMYFPQWSYPIQVQGQKSTFGQSQKHSHESLSQTPENLERKSQEQQSQRPKKVSKPIEKQKVKEHFKKKKEREEDYSRKKQKKDRNLPSNIFKVLSNSIHNDPQMVNYVGKLCPASIQIDPRTFLEKFKGAIKQGQSYIRPSGIQSLCQEGTLTKDQSLVFRIMLKKFVLTEFPTWVVQQTKLNKGQKMTYLKLSKTLYQQLCMNFFK